MWVPILGGLLFFSILENIILLLTINDIQKNQESNCECRCPYCKKEESEDTK